MYQNPYLYGTNPYQNLAQQQQIQFYQNQLQQLEQQQQAQNQFQQMQNQPQQQPANGIAGRMIAKEDDINPFEVPANNQYGFFPTADMSVIYAKMWDKNGDIDTRVYVEVPKNQEDNRQDATANAVNLVDELQTFKQEIMARFDALDGTGKAEVKEAKGDK